MQSKSLIRYREDFMGAEVVCSKQFSHNTNITNSNDYTTVFRSLNHPFLSLAKAVHSENTVDMFFA